MIMFPRPSGCREFTLEGRSRAPHGGMDVENLYAGVGVGPSLGPGPRLLYRRGCAQSGMIFQSPAQRAGGKERRAEATSTKVSGGESPAREKDDNSEFDANIADVHYAQLLATCELLQRQNDYKDRQLED
ncbi:hypothetical protein HOY82DRAFT_535418 [Tuber indicum]|nr:hypothetical protein HOY82DRAFT_535418 [Tuber indicum]